MTPTNGEGSRTISLRMRRWAFWIYAAALFTGTHWPALEIPAVIIQRPDLLVHLLIFGVWTILFLATEYTGRAWTGRWVLLAAFTAAAYAGIDESLQAIPALRRYAAVDDFLANLTGIGAAAIGAGALTLRVTRRAGRVQAPIRP